MTPEQALDILKQMANAASVPLQAHIQAQTAYEVLKKAMEKE